MDQLASRTPPTPLSTTIHVDAEQPQHGAGRSQGQEGRGRTFGALRLSRTEFVLQSKIFNYLTFTTRKRICTKITTQLESSLIWSRNGSLIWTRQWLQLLVCGFSL